MLVALTLGAGLPLLSPGSALADPVSTILRGTEPDGSERLLADLALLWRASGAYDGSWLAVKQQADPRTRLRALRLSRAEFAVVDAGDFAAMRPEYPEMVILSALMPLTLHVLARMPDPGPLRTVPGTIIYTSHAGFAAQGLAELARATLAKSSGASPATGPKLLQVNPAGAVDLLRKGLPADTLLLLAAPLGTQEIATALHEDPTLHLLNLAPPLSEAIRRDRPWVFSIQAARGFYPNQAEGVEALAVHLLLVTQPQLSQDEARRMLECLYGRREQVAPFDALFASVDRRVNSEFAKWAPYHATAAKEFGIAQ